MRLYRAHAVVLRTHPIGEADRIITMLSPEKGVIRAVAKGVRRTSSRFGSRLEPFSVVDLQCYEGRSLDTVTQVSVIYPYHQLITRDYDLYTAGAVMVETTEKVAEDDEPNPRIYELLVGALNALSRRRHAPDLVVASYLLRLMTIAGWSPSWTVCAVCSNMITEPFFSVESGGVVCEDCLSPNAFNPGSEVIKLGAQLTKGNWEEADLAPPAIAHDLALLATKYTQWHVERKIRSVAVRERG
ncbi:DNA repair protein RecO [Boudabousia marimammalium]|uniref:DNA repair protein RecO n=1 Tax=Boudabousia marimammalium TaxID=156892 RepID=A0A1Q5PPI7_9ACTO|nr:DNA repair protein RecO [Boudabousia marimammalium]OKL49315.1 DNA repair protein RecO [Boudabousia marimammalium]